MKKYECIQEDKNDCAAASLQSIIKYYGGYLPLEDIKYIINTDEEGTTGYDLVEGAKAIGLGACGKKEIADNILNYKDRLPCIAYIKKEYYYHFIVIYGFNKILTKIKIMDPSIGMTYMKLDDFKNKFAGTLILLLYQKELPKIPAKNKLLKIILKDLKSSKKSILLLSLLSTIIFAFSIFEIMIYRYLFDNIITNNIVIVIILFIIIKNVVTIVKNKISINLKEKIDKQINSEVINRFMRLPFSYYKNKTPGEIISRFNDLDYLKNIIIEIITNTFVNILLVVVCLFIMLKLNKTLLFISLISVFLYILISIIYLKIYKKKVRITQDSKGYYTNKILENIDAIETINNLGIIDSENNKVNLSYNNYVCNEKKLSIYTVTEDFFKNNLIDLSTIIIIIKSAILTYNGFTISEVFMSYMLYNYFISSIKTMLDPMPSATFALSNLEKINSMLIENDNEETSKVVSGDIVIKDLSYELSGTKILDNINMKINLKDKIFLTSPSGSGKSTLLKILLKYKTKYTGNVYINNINLKDINSKVINNSITYIGQNERLFSLSIEDNILLGRNISKEREITIKKICFVEEIINSKKLKDDLLIENSGFNLSGGERQRIILARGLLKDSEYIFIDEALSEVDEDMEKKIVSNILKYFSDKTIIYISHKKNLRKLFAKTYDLERRLYD